MRSLNMNILRCRMPTIVQGIVFSSGYHALTLHRCHSALPWACCHGPPSPSALQQQAARVQRPPTTAQPGKVDARVISCRSAA